MSWITVPIVSFLNQQPLPPRREKGVNRRRGRKQKNEATFSTNMAGSSSQQHYDITSLRSPLLSTITLPGDLSIALLRFRNHRPALQTGRMSDDYFAPAHFVRILRSTPAIYRSRGLGHCLRQSSLASRGVLNREFTRLSRMELLSVSRNKPLECL